VYFSFPLPELHACRGLGPFTSRLVDMPDSVIGRQIPEKYTLTIIIAKLSTSRTRPCHAHAGNTDYTIQKNSSGRTARTGIHRGPQRGPERFVTQHAQLQTAEHELHTSGGELKGRRGQRRHTRQHFCDSRAVALRAAHCSRQGTRAWGAQPRRRAYAAPSEGRPSQACQHEDGTWETAEPALPQRQKGGGLATECKCE